MYILSIIIIIIFTIIIYKYLQYKNNIKLQNEIQNIRQQYISENKQKLENEIRHELSSLQDQLAQADQELRQRIEHLNRLEGSLRAITSEIDLQKQSMAATLKNYETAQRDAIDVVIAKEAEDKRNAIIAEHAQLMSTLGAQAEKMKEEMAVLTDSIAQYSAKQAAINEAIMRQREVEEQQDFYRVCLGPEAANDVIVLNQARQNLKKPEIIDKIIYDNYISKPVLEMLKRVLQNNTCSGIYKITCLKTGEIYIGKSTDIKSRWQQHCKSAFNCGTIAHSLLHTKMKQHGIECFTFEVVEQVPKDQLSEREKFYINFYQTKETGLNERNG